MTLCHLFFTTYTVIFVLNFVLNETKDETRRKRLKNASFSQVVRNISWT